MEKKQVPYRREKKKTTFRNPMLSASEGVILTAVVRRHNPISTALTLKFKREKIKSFLKGQLDACSVIPQSRDTLPTYESF